MQKNRDEQNDSAKKWMHLPIAHLIYASEDFIVFIDEKLYIDWQTTDVHDTNGIKDRNKHNRVLNRAATIECIPNFHQNAQIRLNFKRMIAEGIARSLNNDYDNADQILNDAKRYIVNRNIEKARFWQLSTTSLIGIISALLIIILWSLKSYVISVLGITAFSVLISSQFGSLGATLSIIFRIGTVETTSEAEHKLHILESVTRNFGGMISAIVVAFLILLELILPIFQNSNSTLLLIACSSILAGSSERWVPSIVKVFDQNSLKLKHTEND